jgi:hypothetical protein
MSLAVAALRILTVKALEGATSAGAQVFDSAVDPRDLIGDRPQPTIVVYADGGKLRFTGRDLGAADHVVDLTIEMFIARATRVAATDGEDEIEIEYPATDAAFENRLRRLCYEILSVLSGGSGAWPELWRRFAVRMAEADSEWDRGADAKNGRRFNFLRLTLRVEVLADPVRGGCPPLPGGAWYALLAAMEADAELADLAKDWRALITTPDLAAWRRAQADLGLTYDEVKGIGLAPLLDHQATPDSDAAGLTGGMIDPDAVDVGLLDEGDPP